MEVGRTFESCCIATNVAVASSLAVAAKEQSWTIPVPSDIFSLLFFPTFLTILRDQY
jgi:hypothetical protein